jgi:hypothetical protein
MGVLTTIELAWARNDVSERGKNRSTLQTTSRYYLNLAQALEIKRKQWNTTDWEASLKAIKSRGWSLLPLCNKGEVDIVVKQQISRPLKYR